MLFKTVLTGLFLVVTGSYSQEKKDALSVTENCLAASQSSPDM